MNQQQAAAALRLAYSALDVAKDAGVTWDESCCPVCRIETDPRARVGPDYDKRHADDCTLVAALAAIRALLPDVDAQEG